MHFGLFQEAQRSLSLFLDQERAIQEHTSQIIRDRAGLMISQSAIRSGDPLGERKILEYARNTSPDPLGNQALLEAAHYYFNAREYGQAVHFYNMVQTAGLGETARSELLFKRGYCHFVQKNFAQARSDFASVRDVRNDYYYPVNYYHGMTLFFEGRYDDALQSFRRVEESPRYAPYMPYVISQILFAQGRYDEMIRYAEPKLEGRTENRMEIENLLGRAWFEKGDYVKALPHLRYYAERSSSLQPADLYQLGYCAYVTGDYPAAIKNLEPLTRQQDTLGQNALFLLGDAYLKTDQKVAARNAFMQASRMAFSPEIAESALFQFAKLSYELRADREAVQALTAIPANSPHHGEAQRLLGEVLVRTEDIDFALEFLSKADLRTPQLKEAYQKVHYAKAAQLVEKGELSGSVSHLKKAMSTPVDNRTQALAGFLLAEVQHRLGQYAESQAELGRFLTLARTVGNLPEEASPALGNYLQGYNLLKLEKFSQATGFFQEAVATLKKDAHKTGSALIRNNVLGDAIMRTGDCFFKVNKYTDALGYYNDAINNKFAGYHYARFQKALILGLQGKPFDKIVELDQLVADFPNSDYADDALFEIGKTSMDMGKLMEAARPFNKLLSDYGKRSPLANAARLKLGLISYNQGDLQEAIRFYRQVLENNPDPEERQGAIAALEEIYVRDLSSPDEYFAILEKSGQNLSDASRDSLNFKSADIHFQNGQYDKAIAAYSQYLDRFPNGIHVLQAHYRRGESHSIRKEFSQALKDYDLVIQRGASRFLEDALAKAAVIAYNHSEDYRAALGYYRQLEDVAGSEPQRFEAQLGAMRSAYRAGGQEDAVLRYTEKVSKSTQARDNHVGQARFYQGKVLYDRRQFDQAIPAFEEVLRLLSDEMAGEAHYLIASIHFAQRKLPESRSWCLRSNQSIPGQDYWVAKCIILLSDIFVEENDLFNARAALEGLMENYHGDADIRKTAQEKLEHIQVLEGRSSRLAPPRTDGLLDLQED